MSFDPTAFRTGFVPDSIPFPEDPSRIEDAASFLRDAGGLPSQADNSGSINTVGGIRDQGDADACVPFEMLALLGMSLSASGYTGSCVFAPALTYWAAQAYAAKLQGLPPEGPFPDNGASPSFVAAASNLVGITEEPVWPYDPNNQKGGPSDQESFRVSSSAAPKIPLVKNAFAPVVFPAGPSLITACKQIIAQPGGRVSFSICAGPNFRSANGATILVQDQGTENHFAGVFSYFTVTKVSGSIVTLSNGIVLPCQALAKPGDTVFGLGNSWGIEWSPLSPIRPGTALVHESFLNASNFFYRCPRRALP